jgi:N12 class adenine-specific DNA methylase
LDKIDDLPFETLKSTQVVWNEFVSGQYWQGEGRQFIMGKYVPKTPGDRWSREVVDGDVDNEGLKRKLAQKFSSRIDWNALEIAEPIVKNYTNGDRKFINGQEYEMSDGHWSKVIQENESIVALDPSKFGVSSMQELKAKLATPETTLDLSAEHVFNIYKQYPDLLSPLQKQAIEFAMSQPKTKYHEQIFRGSIIGGLLGRYQNRIAEGINEPTELAYLQELVTKEIDKYGHPLNNKKLLLTGASSKMFGLFINAVDTKGNFSDLLSGTMEQAGNALQYDSTNLQSIVEHLAVREGFMEMELEDIQKLYTGKQEIKSLGDLAHEDNIAITPGGMVMPISRYCAGDIYPKLVAMTQAMATEQDDRLIAKYQKQIVEINLKRKVTPAEDIIFGLQQKWYGRKYLVDFLRENGYPGLKYGKVQTFQEQEALSGEMINRHKFVEDYDDPFGSFTLPGKLDGFDKQFLDYLNGGKVTSSKAENIEAYKQNVKIIEDRFNAWMQQHPEIDQVADAFNVKFNGYVPFAYGGEPLGLKEISPQVKLHDYQNASIRRLSEEGRGILAHDVGLGKTFQALGLFTYNKQMGRSKKTCIVVPKAVLANWYHESKMFLDNHHDVLFVGFDPKMAGDKPVQEVVKDEYGNPKKNKYTGQVEYQDVLVADSPQEVYEKMWKIPQTNLSLVVMTLEKFGAIPMKASSKMKYTDKMVGKQLISDRLAISVLTNDDKPDLGKGKDKISYDEAKQMDRYRQIYSDEGTSKKGEFPYYEDMGFDAVICDEAHFFKNSMESGKETGQIAYLPTAPASKRAVDMTMKMDYLRTNNNGRGAYLLTATPVTNSPFEIFNMLGLVCDVADFERFGVYTVDDFIRVFGKIEPVDKVKVSTEVVTRDGLTGFQNLDGLRNLFHKYVNMKDAKDVNLPLPPATEQHEEVEMTAEQQTLYEELREEAKEASKPGSGISMFSVIRNMDRVTTDMDLYKHTMTFVFPGAGKDSVEKLLASLPESISITRPPTPEEELAGVTGMVKTSVPLRIERQEENGNYVVAVPEYYEESVVSKFKLFGIDSKDVSHPIMPKYAKMIENIKKEYGNRSAYDLKA